MIKYFYGDSKLNWVDTNNRFVGFDAHQCCCESFGYKIAFAGAETSDDDNFFTDGNDFVFVPFDDDTNKDAEYGTFSFKSESTGAIGTLTVYNEHNGYYSHGFYAGIDKTTEIYGSI
jgi:hypothetical protein